MTPKTKERISKVLDLRETQGKTFREIGQIFGVNPERASQLYDQAIRLKNADSSDPFNGLSVRAWNVVNNMMPWDGVERTKEQMVEIISAKNLKNVGNCGKVTMVEILNWAGLPLPVKKERPPKKKKFCPHCGKEI